MKLAKTFLIVFSSAAFSALVIPPGFASAAQEGAKSSEEISVLQVQQVLKAKGYDPGKLDGAMGPKTRGAIKAFQNASGLTGTGELDDGTLDKLGLKKSPTSETITAILESVTKDEKGQVTHIIVVGKNKAVTFAV